MKYRTQTATMIFMICILAISLACSGSAISTPQAMETPQTDPAHGITPKAAATSEQICAKVTAQETLNLRETAGGTVIGTLYNGEVVQVADNTLQDWLLVIIEKRAGFASADYLEIVPCFPSD